MTTPTKQVPPKSRSTAAARPARKRRDKPSAQKREFAKQLPAKGADKGSSNDDKRSAKAQGQMLASTAGSAAFFQAAVPVLGGAKGAELPWPTLDWKGAQEGMQKLWKSMTGPDGEQNVVESEGGLDSKETAAALPGQASGLSNVEEKTRVQKRINLSDWSQFPSQDPKQVSFWAGVVTDFRAHQANATKRPDDIFKFVAKWNNLGWDKGNEPPNSITVTPEGLGNWNSAFPPNWRLTKSNELPPVSPLKTTPARKHPSGVRPFHYPWKIVDGKLMPELSNPTLHQLRDIIMKVAILRLYEEKPDYSEQQRADALGVRIRRFENDDSFLRKDLLKSGIPFYQAIASTKGHPLYKGYSADDRTAVEYPILRNILAKHSTVSTAAEDLHILKGEVIRLQKKLLQQQSSPDVDREVTF